MDEISVGRTGRITSGKGFGKFVKIIDDSSNTGVFLILMADDIEFRAGHDDWVETRGDLESYLEEAQWSIEWL